MHFETLACCNLTQTADENEEVIQKVSLTFALIFLALFAYFSVLYVSSYDMADGTEIKNSHYLNISFYGSKIKEVEPTRAIPIPMHHEQLNVAY